MAPWYAYRLVAPAILAALLAGPAVAEEAVMVTLDQAKVMRIAAPAGTIIIGNPSIADATLQDSQTLVITGRAYGSTNLIILDEEGEPVTDTQVVVQAPDRTVTVYRGPLRTSFSCTPTCQPTVVPGDVPEFFGTIQSQNAAHAGAATGQAASASANAPAN
jgi:hypothetical protein